MGSVVLVTGGTGRLGRRVVGHLRNSGCDVRVLTRHRHEDSGGVTYLSGDLSAGTGIGAAVAEAGSVVHCATSTKGDAAATRHLVAAMSRAGAPHIVFPSIVGSDRLRWGYPQAKLAAEDIVSESGLPWTIVRATQFFDYILAGLRTMAGRPVIPVPAGVDLQPIDPDEVAARLVELTLSGPAGRAPDLAGPQITTWVDMLRDYLDATGKRRLLMPVRIPGTGAIRGGGLLPGPGHTAAEHTWAQFLSATGG